MKSDLYDRVLANTQKHHATSKTFSGRFLFRYAERIKRLVDELGCETMLDYGCGKGVQYRRPMESGQMLEDFFGMRGRIAKYDPGLPEVAKLPDGEFDIVICTQVLCWIPKADIPWVVDLLCDRARKAVFIGERIRAPKKTINAGMEEHMPYNWSLDNWKEALARTDVCIAPGQPLPIWLGTDKEMIRIQ